MPASPTVIQVSATGQWVSGFKTNIAIRDFPRFPMDEPEDFGGTDAGPSPMEYVTAALNGCKGVMISMIAKEMNFSFNGLDLSTTGTIDTRGLMGENGISPHFQEIHFTVEINTQESDERMAQLKKEVERRCPAYNLLKDAGIRILSEWKKAQQANVK